MTYIIIVTLDYFHGCTKCVARALTTREEDNFRGSYSSPEEIRDSLIEHYPSLTADDEDCPMDCYPMIITYRIKSDANLYALDSLLSYDCRFGEVVGAVRSLILENR